MNGMEKIEARRKASMNATADVFSLGSVIRVSVEARDLSVEDRRKLFKALLFDREINPGSASFTTEQARRFFAQVDKWCGWEA